MNTSRKQPGLTSPDPGYTVGSASDGSDIMKKESFWSKLFNTNSYNIITDLGTAASRVYFHLKAEAVRMGE